MRQLSEHEHFDRLWFTVIAKFKSAHEFVYSKGAQEAIPPAYVAWRASTTNRVYVLARQATEAGGIEILEFTVFLSALNVCKVGLWSKDMYVFEATEFSRLNCLTQLFQFDEIAVISSLW